MRTTDLDAVAPLYPVNKTAGRVAGKGEIWESKKVRAEIDNGKVVAHAPLPLQPKPFHDPTFIDMTGRKVGKLTIVGYAGEKGNGSSRWVVRCACGTYEHRRGKTLRNAAYAARAACSECDAVDQMRQLNSSVKRR